MLDSRFVARRRVCLSSERAPGTGGCLLINETGKRAATHFHFAKPFVRLAFDATTDTCAIIKRALCTLSDCQMIQPLLLRRGERLVTRNVLLTRTDGSHLLCDILDMSSQGMFLGRDARPALIVRVILGRTAGFVAPHHNNGFAIRIHERTPVSNLARFRQPIASLCPHSPPDSMASPKTPGAQGLTRIGNAARGALPELRACGSCTCELLSAY